MPCVRKDEGVSRPLGINDRVQVFSKKKEKPEDQKRVCGEPDSTNKYMAWHERRESWAVELMIVIRKREGGDLKIKCTDQKHPYT